MYVHQMLKKDAILFSKDSFPGIYFVLN